MMKLTFLVSVSLLAFTKVKAQDSIFSSLVKDAIYTHRDSPTVYYIDSSFALYGKFSGFAKGRKITGFLDLRAGTRISMRFTRRELKNIDNQLANQSRILWPVTLFENSVRMPNDSIESYSRYLRIPGFKQDKYKYYYYLGQPVFIRGNTVAIFNMAEMIHPSAGYNFVFIYIKEGSLWKRKMTMVTGAW